MANAKFIQTQQATQSLEHGRIVWTTDNANIIRMKRTAFDSSEGREPPPTIEFVGEGVATYDIKLIYQPAEDDFPCLVSYPRFSLHVFWDEDVGDYVSKPVDIPEMNRSSRWLYDGVRTMNALREYSLGHVANAEIPKPPITSESADNSRPSRIGEFIGAVLGTAGRVYLQ